VVDITHDDQHAVEDSHRQSELRGRPELLIPAMKEPANVSTTFANTAL